MKIGIFYGSSTGNTETAAEQIKAELGDLPSALRDVRDAKAQELQAYDVLLLGVSTWNIGEIQDDWGDLLPQLESVDLSGKKVAIFAQGDAQGYPYNYLDGMGELWRAVEARGAELIGVWPTESYEYEDSQALYDENHFFGLGLDEDNEPELTEERVHNWLVKVVTELGFDVSTERKA